ncbi:MAG: hypothetical protein M3137_05790 [Actinomycetota bacterium]|nr:hypothetical protein [Actinomycetota bacterium]
MTTSNAVSSPTGLSVTSGGTPTESEVAAILVAVEALWPRPVTPEAGPSGPHPWRFSGRWWVRPVAARRNRPWVRPLG